jgi:signal transduction histidine kinase
VTLDARILVLDDEPAILDMVLLSLAPGDWSLGDGEERTPCVVTATTGELAGTRFLVARSGEEARDLSRAELDAGARLSGGFFDLALPTPMQGTDAMRALRALQPGLLCTVITGTQVEMASVLEIFAPDRLDEWDFVSKPFTRAEITQRCRQMIAAAARREREDGHLREIQRLNKELELWARSLERRVAQRTEQLGHAMSELERKNVELESVLEVLHQTQADLVQHEKMATIGQLASGVARELSRPLQFSQQATAGIERSLSRLADFAQRIEEHARQRPEASREAAAVRASFAELCREQRPGASGAEASSLLEHVAEGLDRSTGIVRALSSFASASSGDRKPIDVVGTLGAAIDFVRGSLQRGEQLEAELGDLPEVVGNAAELQHAWLQMLRNAVDATCTRPGDARIRVVARREGADAIVEFEDNGDGIADDLRDRVFEPFFTTRGRKAGLGLSVVHGIVARHGGSVDVTSAPGGGTVLRVRLPLARPARLRAC